MSKFCEDVTIRRKLGVNLKADNLLSDSDTKLKPHLEEIRKGLTKLKKKICASFDSISCEKEMVNWRNKPHELLRKSIGCTEQCPFCGEQCDMLDSKHVANGRKHMTAIHRPSCLATYRWSNTDFCPALVASNVTFRNDKTNEKSHPIKGYQSIYPDWSIPPDPTAEDSLYWRSNYMDAIAEKFDAKPPPTPQEWRDIKWAEVKRDLERMYRL